MQNVRGRCHQTVAIIVVLCSADNEKEIQEVLALRRLQAAEQADESGQVELSNPEELIEEVAGGIIVSTATFQ